MILTLYHRRGLTTIRENALAAIGTCPACGSPAFAMNLKTNRYRCADCKANGDTIQFCRDYLGMTFKQACEATGRTNPPPEAETPPPPRNAPQGPLQAATIDAAKLDMMTRQIIGGTDTTFDMAFNLVEGLEPEIAEEHRREPSLATAKAIIKRSRAFVVTGN